MTPLLDRTVGAAVLF